MLIVQAHRPAAAVDLVLTRSGWNSGFLKYSCFTTVKQDSGMFSLSYDTKACRKSSTWETLAQKQWDINTWHWWHSRISSYYKELPHKLKHETWTNVMLWTNNSSLMRSDTKSSLTDSTQWKWAFKPDVVVFIFFFTKIMYIRSMYQNEFW